MDYYIYISQPINSLTRHFTTTHNVQFCRMTDLDRAEAALAAELQSYTEDGYLTITDEKSDSNSTIVDRFYDRSGAVGIAQMTNFR